MIDTSIRVLDELINATLPVDATGAAARLGIPRQTLESKIQRLGIDKYRHKRAIPK